MPPAKRKQAAKPLSKTTRAATLAAKRRMLMRGGTSTCSPAPFVPHVNLTPASTAVHTPLPNLAATGPMGCSSGEVMAGAMRGSDYVVFPSVSSGTPYPFSYSGLGGAKKPAAKKKSPKKASTSASLVSIFGKLKL